MRGSIRQRYKGSWSLVLDLGYQPDPETGRLKRKQRWVTYRGTKKQAEGRLTELLHSADHGQFVEPSKVSLTVWLPDWLKAIKPTVRPSTFVRYTGIVHNSILKAPVALVPLQKLRPSHLERSYAAHTELSASTLLLHHTVFLRALRKALKDHLVSNNVAVDLDGKPRRTRDREDARKHAWTAEEAQQFLTTAKAAGPQPAALYSLALDTGMRKGELLGLRWADVDLDKSEVRIVRQLLAPGPEATFGPTKTGKVRTVTISSEIVALLREHKRAQAEVKMANRTAYHDGGLVFAKGWGEVRTHKDVLGHPLQANNIGQREFAGLIKAAGVRPIKFHGLRHTAATLLLQAGVPVHVVAERLGHAKVSMTMEVYAHVLPNMQQHAATVMGALLHGTGTGR